MVLISSLPHNITSFSPHPLKRHEWQSKNMALYPVGSKSISVLNHLPTVHTLFLHPPLRSCQPFHALVLIKNPTLGLSSACNTFKSSVQTQKHALRNWILWTNCKIFDQIPKDGQPLLPLLQSSVNLGCARRQKAWQKDASVVGRRGCNGSRVRANLN